MKLLFMVAALLSFASQTSAPSYSNRLAVARKQRQSTGDGDAFWNLGRVTEVYPTLFLGQHPSNDVTYEYFEGVTSLGEKQLNLCQPNGGYRVLVGKNFHAVEH
jgi:hypothetical protein